MKLAISNITFGEDEDQQAAALDRVSQYGVEGLVIAPTMIAVFGVRG